MVLALNRFLSRLVELLVFAVFLIMVLVVFGQVVLRYIFGVSLPWGSELSQYGMVWLCFLGAALAVKERDHMRVDYFINLLPRSLLPFIHVLLNIILFAFVAYLSYSSVPITRAFMQDITPGLGIPYGLVSLAMPVGGVLMLLYLITDSVQWLSGETEEASQ
ncbi:TRAP transporter permease DctQ [Pollutimonas subterranea]|uniref:TRAP transporter small permease protein n=1 Tax=Pollutimonas subterranea TaxID=2045210 RepID=A0A2N4U5C1_9BURK|nr:TRAP transporter small permease [Pollutimonas subterranea]PLC50212.1 TRAP transporter permease DctQ [Pollutimonas subterranea]